LEHVIFKRL